MQRKSEEKDRGEAGKKIKNGRETDPAAAALILPDGVE